MKHFAKVVACLLASASLISCGASQTTLQEYKNDSLPPDIEVLKDIEYGKAGDVSLRLNIIRQKEKAEKPLPALVFIHGGGWCSGNKDDSTGLLCGIAQLGYVCVSVEYRFFSVATYPAQIEDCKNAIRFLRAKSADYNIDPDRIGAWGDSAGGHLAALLCTTGDVKELEGEGGWQDYSSRINAACDWYGPVGLADSTLPEDHIYSQLLGSTPQANRDLARLSDPVSFISKDDPPILIMHGDMDESVPIALSRQFYEKLKQAGADVTFDTIKDAGHGDGFWGKMEIYEKVLAFFDRELNK